jgi:hypothetical protein
MVHIDEKHSGIAATMYTDSNRNTTHRVEIWRRLQSRLTGYVNSPFDVVPPPPRPNKAAALNQ